MTPEQRSIQARADVLASWARTEDRAARTRPGTEAFLAGFEYEVDPDGTLPEAERARRAEAARRSYFQRLALRSSTLRLSGLGIGLPASLERSSPLVLRMSGPAHAQVIRRRVSARSRATS